MSTFDPVAGLREAVRLSPENIPLRRTLAETLMSLGRAEEAEKEFRAAVAAAPADFELKVGLASAYYAQGRAGPAAVIMEELLKLGQLPARGFVLHARILFTEGETERAVRQYKRGIELDPAAGDGELAGRLGVSADAADPTADVIDGRMRAAAESAAGGADVPVERPKAGFADVGGMDGLKDEIRMKIIHPLTKPELYKAYGKAVGGGILMYGPPGCGKTHLARATAGEIKASFLSVGINDVLDMWIGNSEKNLHELFDQARRNRPCVLFFDEVDALAASRSDMKHSASRIVINQFLAELDGVDTSNEGVLILAATNAPWHLDTAFRRPGRFDRILFVPPPDAPARASILRVLLKGKPTDNVDCDYIAKKADQFSGADLKATIDAAIEIKLKEAFKDGIARPLTTKDLLAATGSIRPTTREWFASARNHALYANQGGMYDDVLKYLKM